MTIIKELSLSMKGYRKQFGGALFAIGMVTFIDLLQPQIIRVVLDVGLGNEAWTGNPWTGLFIQKMGGSQGIRDSLWTVAGLMVLVSSLGGLFLYLKGRWTAQAAEGTVKDMRDRLYQHIQSLPFSSHVQASTGDLIQRCTSDVDTLRNFLSTQAVEIGRGGVILVLTASLMFVLDTRMALISLILVPFIFCFGYFFFLRIQTLFRDADQSEGDLSATLQENLAGIRVVRAFARRQYEEEKFDSKNHDYRKKNYYLIRLLAWHWAVVNTLTLSQLGLVWIVGGISASRGDLSLGTLVVFFTYSAQLLWPVRQMGEVLSELGKTKVALERIKEVLAEKPEEETGRFQGPVQGRIEFKNVSFAYPGGAPVLNNVSFTVEPGEVIALLGSTGAGKSTLAQLIPRLYEPDSGTILIDGVPSTRWHKKHLRRQISIILQEPFLFNRTVRENIVLAAHGSLEQEINEAARNSCLHEVIKSFEKGYETIVGEGGVTLSGGQKQRMALARTLIQQSSVLILDDSLSAVDAETDALIRERLHQRDKKQTVILIAHRLATLKEARRILVLQEGRIAQQGSHKELIQKEGLYKRIWDIQSSGAVKTS